MQIFIIPRSPSWWVWGSGTTIEITYKRNHPVAAVNWTEFDGLRQMWRRRWTFFFHFSHIIDRREKNWPLTQNLLHPPRRRHHGLVCEWFHRCENSDSQVDWLVGYNEFVESMLFTGWRVVKLKLYGMDRERAHPGQLELSWQQPATFRVLNFWVSTTPLLSSESSQHRKIYYTFTFFYISGRI